MKVGLFWKVQKFGKKSANNQKVVRVTFPAASCNFFSAAALAMLASRTIACASCRRDRERASDYNLEVIPRKFKGESGLFFTGINAKERRPYWSSYMEVSYCTFRFGASIWVRFVRIIVSA